MIKNKELKVLHAGVLMNPGSGIIKQMEGEKSAALDAGLNWDVVLHVPRQVGVNELCVFHDLSGTKLMMYFGLRWRFYNWLLENEKKYDLILLRHSLGDIFELAIVRRIGYKVITVHHTMEIEELLTKGVSGKVHSLLEKSIGGAILSRCIGVVGVTDEILKYELGRVPSRNKKITCIYPNGINIVNQSTAADNRGLIPEIVFCAYRFSEWHGLDLLIKAVKRSGEKFVIHLVGELDDDDYHESVKDSRFVIHGILDEEAKIKIYERAWCGLSSFALERNGITEACTLKVREYLAYGLPVYSGHRDTALPFGFEYYKIGKADLHQILEFADKMRGVSRDEVWLKAYKYISKRALLSNLYSELLAQCEF